MEFPVILSTNLPQTVCGIDERVRVDPMTSPPYNWICFLSIESHDGHKYIASGFKINLPEINCMVVVTSGHCTYVNNQYAKKIIVTFPNQGTVTAFAKDFYASPEYIATGNPDFDYGMILLDGNSNDGFGWTSIIPDSELDNRLVTNCGFPGDKPRATLWITGGPVHSYTPNRIYYMNDTAGGQSGSPVYTWCGGYWTVLGVHSYGGCPNSAVRFTPGMIRRFYQRANALNSVTIRSSKFPDVYLRCDGSKVDKFTGPGSGVVNCQYKPALGWELFHIFPIAMKPSLAPPSEFPVLILSAQWDNVYIRMDGSGMNKTNGSGGGVVNCQYGAGLYEQFYYRSEGSGGLDGKFSFRNVYFPHCFLRLDGTNVTEHTAPGGGTVNCQYYDDPSSALPNGVWETFYIS